ncbi:MAG TPA: hypothetical protein IAB92_06950, partial [Candidatus Faecousia faecigallinarum]|nr:hypothetical protein [Candidatus Faecousia faecigallinarum]
MPILPGLRRNGKTILALILAAAIFVGLYLYAHGGTTAPSQQAEEYAEYESGKVLEILTDNCEPDPTAEGAYRGEQTLLVEVTSGQYKGQTILTDNAVGPLYGEPAKAGQRVTLILSTYADGTVRASVYEYDRSLPIALVLAVFFLVTVLVGGKTGAKSILGLAFSVAVLLLL